jgi:hypothetical protein
MANKNLRPTEIESKSIVELNITTINHVSTTRGIVPTATNLLVQCARSVSIYTEKKSAANTSGITKKILVNLMVKIDHITKWTKMQSGQKMCRLCILNKRNYGCLPSIINFIAATALVSWCDIVPHSLSSSGKPIQCCPLH